MNKIEINTIVEALAKKSTWIVKGFNNFLKIWEKQTKNMENLPGRFKKIIILEKDIIDKCGYVCEERRYFIKIGWNGVDFDYTNDHMECWENSDHYPEITAELVREIMAEDLSNKIRNHFKKVQNSIDVLLKTEEKMNELIKKLA